MQSVIRLSTCPLKMIPLLLMLCHITVAFVPLKDFVKFGTKNDDNYAAPGDDVSIPLKLTHEIPFYGAPYKQLWLNYNGGISSKRVVDKFTPLCQPMGSSMQMIMAFWADVVIYSNDVGMLYYRETQNPEVLEQIADVVAQAYPTLINLRLSNAIISTWLNVSFFGVPTCGYGSLKRWPRNTFQAILATDQSRTFAIFNYNSIVWTTAKTSRGNCRGLGGTPARIGIDAGDGKTLAVLNGSCTNDIVKVAEKSNVGVPGRYVFRVDSNQIELDSYNDTKYTTEQLMVNPKFVDTWDHVNIDDSKGSAHAAISILVLSICMWAAQTINS